MKWYCSFWFLRQGAVCHQKSLSGWPEIDLGSGSSCRPRHIGFRAWLDSHPLFIPVCGSWWGRDVSLNHFMLITRLDYLWWEFFLICTLQSNKPLVLAIKIQATTFSVFLTNQWLSTEIAIAEGPVAAQWARRICCNSAYWPSSDCAPAADHLAQAARPPDYSKVLKNKWEIV